MNGLNSLCNLKVVSQSWLSVEVSQKLRGKKEKLVRKARVDLMDSYKLKWKDLFQETSYPKEMPKI